MRLVAGSDESGLRADVWLSRRLDGLSRSRVQALIKSGDIVAVGRPLTTHLKVNAGLEVLVSIPPPELAGLIPEEIPVDVVFEDADIIIVNKPAGLVVHPAAGHRSGTLVNALLHHCRDLAGVGGELRPGIVHRLDKDTSGVMAVAKNDVAMDDLAAQFRGGTVTKEYVALVHGVPDPPAGRVETLIGRSRHDRKRMSTRPASGRKAISHYAVVEKLGLAAVLHVRIETGRTHQIRVHLAHIRHPVLGDLQYGARKEDPGLAAPRQMLHAARLALCHPGSGERMSFKAPLPADMLTVLERLRSLRGA